MHRFVQLWAQAFAEAGKCLALGVKDAASFKLGLRSSALCILVTLVWIWAYYHYAAAIGTFLLAVALVGTMGLLLCGFQGLLAMPAAGGGSVVAMGNMAGGMLQIGQAVLVMAAIAAALYVLVFLLAVASTVRLAVPHLLLPTAIERARKIYPAPASADDGQLAPTMSWRKRFLILALLCVPVLAAAMLILLACYLNVRLIYGSVAKRSGQRAAQLLALQWRWRPLLLIGVACLLLLVIPVFNLLVPALMCTAVIRLAFRNNLDALRAGGGCSGGGDRCRNSRCGARDLGRGRRGRD
ncbi:MAG: hypothetical protein ACJ8GW_01580 [Massilia sp.]